MPYPHLPPRKTLPVGDYYFPGRFWSEIRAYLWLSKRGLIDHYEVVCYIGHRRYVHQVWK